jgi:hypothetical protein
MLIALNGKKANALSVCMQLSLTLEIHESVFKISEFSNGLGKP